MNSIFRNVRGNERLDSLEESESEDEFESKRNGKIVNKRGVPMKCIYDNKFKRWVPTEKI